MATAPMTFGSQDYRVFRPGLFDVFLNESKAFPSRVGDVFQTHSSDKPYEEMISYAPIGPFEQWNADGDDIAYEVPGQRYVIRVTNLDYSKGTAYTHKMQREFKYRQSAVLDATRTFARASAHTKETTAASFLNTAFATATHPWYVVETKYFFSATHTTATSATCSNLASGALTFSTLSSAVTTLRATVDDRGRPMMLEPDTLIVPSDLELLAKELVISPDRPDATERAKSVIYKLGLKVVVWPYLTSSTAWFLRAPLADCGTLYFEREGLTQRMQTDNIYTWNDYHSAAYACSFGAKTWRGWVGSLGT